MPLRKMTAHSFIREHVKTKLKLAGHSEEAAEAMVGGVSDKEIDAQLPKEKTKALGDGKLLDWLLANGPKLREVVENIFSLLSLLKQPAAAEKAEEDTAK